MKCFDTDGFEQSLTQHALSLGSPLHYFQQTSSTNDCAKKLARQGAAHGTLCIADQQTSGRGRQGKTWLATAGESLLFSLILRPQRELSQLSPLTLAIGLGVCEGLAKHTAAKLQIKWPNDVLHAGKKLAGILVETELAEAGSLSLVVGIGININATNFPPEIKLLATSLAVLNQGRFAEREAVLADVLARIDHWLKKFDAGGPIALITALNQRDALAGKRLRIEQLEGEAKGIDAQGRLILATTHGDRHISAGTVEIL